MLEKGYSNYNEYLIKNALINTCSRMLKCSNYYEYYFYSECLAIQIKLNTGIYSMKPTYTHKNEYFVLFCNAMIF